MTHRLGSWSFFATLPLTEGFRDNPLYAIEASTPAETAFHLRDRVIDVGLLSPIECAKESSNLLLVPGSALWSYGSTGAVTVHFRNGLQEVETLAVDPSYPSEAVLAKILLAEEFDIEPRIVPMTGGRDAMLDRADAALLVGDAALAASAFHTDALDLVETWVQLTDLPYVHGVWCAHEEDATTDLARAIRQGRKDSPGQLAAIAARTAEKKTFLGFSAGYLSNYLEQFSYDLTDEAIEGLKEFHHFAYYHGVLPDVPEITVFESKPDNG